MKFELDLLETIAYNVSNKEEKIFQILWNWQLWKIKGYFQYVPNDMTLKEAIIMYRKLLNIKW